MNAKSINISVGDIESSGKRFIEAWRRIERGRQRDTEYHLTFESLDGLIKVLTPKRFELIKALHDMGETNISALARKLGRNYKNVYEDVEALSNAGIILRRDRKIIAPWDRVTATLDLAA